MLMVLDDGFKTKLNNLFLTLKVTNSEEGDSAENWIKFHDWISSRFALILSFLFVEFYLKPAYKNKGIAIIEDIKQVCPNNLPNSFGVSRGLNS